MLFFMLCKDIISFILLFPQNNQYISEIITVSAPHVSTLILFFLCEIVLFDCLFEFLMYPL